MSSRMLAFNLLSLRVSRRRYQACDYIERNGEDDRQTQRENVVRSCAKMHWPVEEQSGSADYGEGQTSSKTATPIHSPPRPSNTRGHAVHRWA